MTTDQKAGGSNPPGHASKNALEIVKTAIPGRFAFVQNLSDALFWEKIGKNRGKITA